jgi:hypothetical protein
VVTTIVGNEILRSIEEFRRVRAEASDERARADRR